MQSTPSARLVHEVYRLEQELPNVFVSNTRHLERATQTTISF